MVHRGEEDLTGAAIDGLAGPREEFALCQMSSAVGRHPPAAVDLPGVDRHDDELRTVFRGDRVDQRGVSDGGAVDRHLVGPGIEQPSGVVDRGDAAADGEGDVDACGDARNQIGEGAAPLLRGADVEVDQFVGPFGGVLGPEFHGVADAAQILEVNPLDGLPVADVQTGYYSFCKHRSISSRVIRPS